MDQSDTPLVSAIKLIAATTTPQLTQLLKGDEEKVLHLRRQAKEAAKKLAEASIRSGVMRYAGTPEV